MRPKHLIAVATIAILSGCTSGDITAVKELTLQDYPSYTVGQAFDNRPLCRSVDWSTFNDERDRTIVSYRCEMREAKEMFEMLLNREVAGAEEFHEMRIKQYEAAVESYNKQVADFKAIQTFVAQAVEFVSSRDPDEVESQFLSEENATKFKSIGIDIARMLDYARYTSDDSDDSREAAFRSELTNSLNGFVNREGPGPFQEEIWKRNLNDAAERKHKQIELAVKKYHAVDVVEIFQWAIPNDGSPVFIYAGLEVLNSAGEVVGDRNYGSNPGYVIPAIVESKSETATQYFTNDRMGLFPQAK